MGRATLDEVILITMFSTVVEMGSFTAAATALGVTKAAVSQRIAALERRCAARLIERTARRLSLTEEGQQLYDACAGTTFTADDAAPLIERIGRVPRGSLRVTAPTAFGIGELIPALPSFHACFPDITIDLVLTDRVLDLIDERINVAIRYAERLPNSPYRRRRLRESGATDAMVVCGAPSYFAAYGIPREPRDLEQHRCLRLSSSASEWTFHVDDVPIIIPISGPLLSDNIPALRDAAILGSGLALLPESVVAEHIAAKRLDVVLSAFTTTKLSLWVLFRDSEHVPAKARVFIDHLAAFRPP